MQNEAAIQTPPKEEDDSEEEVDNSGDDVQIVYPEEEDTTEEDDNDTSDTDSDEENLENASLVSEEDNLRAGERRKQKRTIKELLHREPRLQEGDTWYLLSSHWSKKWKEAVCYNREDDYVDLNKPSPGPIDNTGLLVPGTTMTKRNLIEEYDFIIVSPEIWDAFIEWYGGGPPLPRKVIAQGLSRHLAVEVRPLCLRVLKSSDPNKEVKAIFSKADTVETLKKQMCETMELDPDNIRVWDYHGGSKLKLLTNMSAKLDEAQILDDQQILMEEKKPDGTWPENRSSTGFGFSSFSSYSSNHSSGPPPAPGLSGLVNLGNTCFMNSALQSLSHTHPLSDYFLRGEYQSDLNETNPLGSKGELATQYAELVKDLWAGRYSSVAPREFKWKLERFATQFAGYHQHDSQELLAFLLDGLHEDLNRVRQKPYREMSEQEGRSDAEVADEAWRNHLDRNNSIIVDWFQGQLKSTLNCPECHKISITFDPFMYLSLPLPQTTTRNIGLTVAFQDPTKRLTRYVVTAPKRGAISELKQALGEMCGVTGNSFAIADVYHSNFFKVFADNDKIEMIQDRDLIYAYETTPSTETEERIILQLLHKKDEPGWSGTTRSVLFGVPTIISVPKGVTYKQLRQYVVNAIQRLIKPEFVKLATLTNSATDVGSPVVVDADSDREGSEVRKSKKKKRTVLVESNESDTTTFGSDMNSTTDMSSSGDEEDESSSKSESEPEGAELFTMVRLDSNGSSEVEQLLDNDLPLPLKDRHVIGLKWTRWGCNDVYNEAAETQKDLHESAQEDKNEENSSNGVSLYSCLDLFTTVEKLGPDDPWYCNRCKEFRQATKKFDLWRLPRILVIHLKRFSFKYRMREKLETFVDFPLYNLDLSAAKINNDGVPAQYDLYAISNHYGGMGGGHYTAYAKAKDGKWYRFDDSSVSPMEENAVKTSAAYVLFYRRKDSFEETPSANSTTPTTTGVASSNSNSDTSTTATTTTTSTNVEMTEADDEDTLIAEEVRTPELRDESSTELYSLEDGQR